MAEWVSALSNQGKCQGNDPVADPASAAAMNVKRAVRLTHRELRSEGSLGRADSTL